MKRLLIVDDETEIPRLLELHMAARGYDVYTAFEGTEALKKVRAVLPDVVLLDIVMPGRGGIEVLKEIKKIGSHIAVVMMTAVIDDQMMETALQSGADGYVIKPFDLCTMVNEVREAIDRYIA
ncbi:MAG: response regulator [Syntrophales bacterium]|nr:response regulator [Syntrophales bacterium]MCK9528037.1 response regulator [Syntrophales bacterium]MDX9921386.1 response regulator [Syntrophales bacterium]